MENTDQKIAELIIKSLNNDLNEGEQQELDSWLLDSPANKAFYEEFRGASLKDKLTYFEDIDPQAGWKKVMANAALRPARVVAFNRKKWLSAAAAILLLISVAAYFLLKNNNPQPDNIVKATPEHTIVPGRDGAVLVLGNGTTLNLDSLQNGQIAIQNGAEVNLTDNQLTYLDLGNASGEMVYNTIHTPVGRQFHLTLPDGTNVWLNSGSSVRFPTTFVGKERLVDITGEVYFEVVKNLSMPFKVFTKNNVEITVLGTHFNVNAYENESRVRATLLEGKVKVKSGKTEALLDPGQQADIGAQIEVQHADVEKVMAWKNGLFHFEGSGIEEVMRELERWYDIEVVYPNGVPNIRFGGKMTRNISFEQLQQILEESRVKFTLEGRKLIIQK